MGNHRILYSLMVNGPIQTARVPAQYGSFLGIVKWRGKTICFRCTAIRKRGIKYWKIYHHISNEYILGFFSNIQYKSKNKSNLAIIFITESLIKTCGIYKPHLLLLFLIQKLKIQFLLAWKALVKFSDVSIVKVVKNSLKKSRKMIFAVTWRGFHSFRKNSNAAVKCSCLKD